MTLPASARVRACILLGILAVVVVAAPASGQSDGVEPFPSRRIFPALTADALEHQLSLSRITDNREWIGAIGAAVPLAGFGASPRLQATAAATVFSRLLKTPGHITVITVDYRVDGIVEAGFGAWAVRLGYGHRSAHYADDAVEQLGRRSISAVKDYLTGGVAWTPPHLPAGVYGIVTWSYHNEPEADLPWELQAGGEARGPLLGNVLTPYVAADVKVKQEVGWGTTQSYQAGVRLFEREGRALRVSYTHRRGFEERGQLFREQTIMHILAATLELF